jgi:hypothetical protein
VVLTVRSLVILTACSALVVACGGTAAHAEMLRTEMVPHGTMIVFDVAGLVAEDTVRVSLTGSRVARCRRREHWTGVPREEEVVEAGTSRCDETEPGVPAAGVEVCLFVGSQEVACETSDDAGRVSFGTRPAHFVRYRAEMAVVAEETRTPIGIPLLDVVDEAEALVAEQAAARARAEAAERDRVAEAALAEELRAGRCSDHRHAALADVVLNRTALAEGMDEMDGYWVALDHQFVVAGHEGAEVSFRATLPGEYHVYAIGAPPVSLEMGDRDGYPVTRGSDYFVLLGAPDGMGDSRVMQARAGETFRVRVRARGCTVVMVYLRRP